MQEDPKNVTFHLDKTASYRSYHIDGAMSSITAKGDLYLEMYLERRPTPKQITISFQGEASTEISREGKNGWIREIECGLLLDLPTAIALRDLLTGQIDSILAKLQSQNDNGPNP